MTDCMVERDRESGRTVMRFMGVFDREHAIDLRDEIKRMEGDVLLDFSLVRAFDDRGVATLAQILAEKGDRSISVRGLREHQLRLFRYIGIDVGSTQP